MESKWQRVFSFSIYLSRHHTQRPMASRLSTLHYSYWPMSHLHEGPHWFLFTLLCENIQSQVQLNMDASKQPFHVSMKRSLNDVLVLLWGFNCQRMEVNGKLWQDMRLIPDHPTRCSIDYSRDSRSRYKFFMSVSKYCSEKALRTLKILSTRISIMYQI